MLVHAKYPYHKAIRLLIIAFVFLAHTVLLAVVYKWFSFRGNDLLTNLAQPTFFINSIKAGIFPAINPYLGYGLPLWLDPLNMVWNPLVFSTLYLLNTHTAIVAMYMIVLWTSGCTMYVVARKAECRTSLAMPIALNYMSTGYLCGAIYAGHLEKILVWPVMPVILFTIFKLANYRFLDHKKHGFTVNTAILAILISYVIFSSSYYALIGIFMVIAINIVITRRGGIIWSVLAASTISAPKLITNMIGMSFIERNYSLVQGAPSITQLIDTLFTFKYNYALGGQKLGWWEYSGGIGLIYLGVLIIVILYNLIHKPRPDKLTGAYPQKINIDQAILITWLGIGCSVVIFYYLPQFADIFSKLRLPTRLYMILIPLTYIWGAHLFSLRQFSKWTILVILILYINISTQYANILEKNNDGSLKIVDINAQIDILDVIKKKKPGAKILTESQFNNQLAAYEVINRKQILINPPYAFYIGTNVWEKYFAERAHNSYYSGQIPDFMVLPVEQTVGLLPHYSFNSELIYINDRYTVFAYTGLNTNHYSNEK